MKKILFAVCACVCAVGSALADLVYPEVTGTQYLSAFLCKREKAKLEGVSDLNFTIVKATGAANIKDKPLYVYFNKMVNGERVVDFQCVDGWIKCVRVIFSQESDGVYVRQDQAYYYRGALGIGSYSWDDAGIPDPGDDKNNLIRETNLGDGTDGGTQYGLKELWLTSPEVRTEALPEGSLVVGQGHELTLKDAAAEGTIANDIYITNAVVTLEAATNVNYTGTINGSGAKLLLKTTGAVESRELAGSEEVTQDSLPDALNISAYQLLFAGAKLDDFTTNSIHSATVTQGDFVITGHPYYLKRAEDGLSLTVELQAQNTSDNWVKCVKIELVQRTDGVYGKKIVSYFYPGKMGSMEKEGTKTYDDFGTDKDIGTSGYEIGKINATYTYYPSEEFSVSVQGFFGSNPRHKYGVVASGYDLADLEDVEVTGTTNMLGTIVREVTLVNPCFDGLEYQYQAEMSDDTIKCIFFRLMQTAENDIVCYTTRTCSFSKSLGSHITLGRDLTDVVATLDNQKYSIAKMNLRFARTAVPKVLTLSGANNMAAGGLVQVTEGSRAHVVTTEAMPKGGTLQVQPNARVTLSKGTAGDCKSTLSIGKGAVVTALARTGLTSGTGDNKAKIIIDGGTLQLLGSHEYEWDNGDYVPQIELKNGALMRGYAPRGNTITQLLVTGTGCSTNAAGVVLGMSGATDVYPITVNDTTGDAGVDLEFAGHISAHPQAKLGGIAKKGAGTMRLTSQYFSTDPWTRVDEGTLLVGRSNMWAGERLVLKGGTLEVEAGITNNVVSGFDLQGNVNLVMGKNATLDLGDVSAKDWGENTITVTMPKSAHLYATGLTDAQKALITINGVAATYADGELTGPARQLTIENEDIKDSAIDPSDEIIFAGGTLTISASNDVVVAKTKLTKTSELVLGAGATFDLGDCTNETWTEGTTLTVTMGEGAKLYGAGLTTDQLAQLKLKDEPKLKAVLRDNGEIRFARSGLVVTIR